MEQQELITVEELDRKQAEVFSARKKYEEADALSKGLYAEFKRLQEEHVSRLEGLGKTSYKTDAGLFSYSVVENVKLDPEGKEEFWNFLRERGLFEQMISVNSNTLNSFAKEEFRAMEAAGELDPQIPGLVKMEPYFKPSMRKA